MAVQPEVEIGPDAASTLKVPILPAGHIFRGCAGAIVDSYIVIRLADSSDYVIGMSAPTMCTHRSHHRPNVTWHRSLRCGLLLLHSAAQWF